jgi:hypothetical protein
MGSCFLESVRHQRVKQRSHPQVQQGDRTGIRRRRRRRRR